MRLRSGIAYALYRATSPLHVKHVSVENFDISPTLQQAVARENAYDVGEAIPEDPREPDDFLNVSVPPTSSMDDIDVLPAVDVVPQPSATPAPAPPSHMSGKKRRKLGKKLTEGANIHARKTARTSAQPAIPVASSIKPEELPSKKGAYSAKTTRYRYRDKMYTLDELINVRGMRLIRWDGINPVPIIVDGKVVAVLIGRPNDDGYVVDCSNAFAVMQEIAEDARFSRAQSVHKRGPFPAVNVGRVAGQGQTYPMEMNTGPFKPFVDRLLSNSSIRRIMGFQSHAVAVWAPRLYAYGVHVTQTMCKKLGISANFSNSIFPCVAFNFGGKVWTWLHQDVMNLAFFWCIITALGDFDPREGGHLVMWDFNLVVEFPPNASIAIPSATVTHSNIPIREHESRLSVTQYLPGGVARWVDNGCMTEKELKVADPEEYDAMQARKSGRWSWGLSLWSTVDELMEL